MSLCLNLDEEQPVRQPFPAMPPFSGRAVSHVVVFYGTTNRPSRCFLVKLVKFVKVKG